MNAKLPIPQFIRDFWRGLAGHTLLSVAGAISLAMLEFATCCWAFQPRRLAHYDARYLQETPADEYLTLSLKLLRMRFATLHDLHVIYLGASQATRALATRDQEILSNQLSDIAGRPVEFHVFSANNERFEEVLAITDQLPLTFRGVFVMTVNDYKDDYRKDKAATQRSRERLALVNAPSILPFWAEQGYKPRHTGIFFVDNLGFFASRRVVGLRLGPVAVPLGAVRADASVNFQKALDKLEQQKERREAFAARAAAREAGKVDDAPAPQQHGKGGGIRSPMLTKSRGVITKIIANMRRRGVPVVFVDNPEMPLRNDVFATRVERFHEQFQMFADDMGCYYWNFNPDLDLQPEDFQDTVHLGSTTGRRKFQRMLLSNLGDLIRKEFGVEDQEGGDDDDVPSSGDTPSSGG